MRSNSRMSIGTLEIIIIGGGGGGGEEVYRINILLNIFNIHFFLLRRHLRPKMLRARVLCSWSSLLL
jgi:hypothetical protein